MVGIQHGISRAWLMHGDTYSVSILLAQGATSRVCLDTHGRSEMLSEILSEQSGRPVLLLCQSK